MKKHRWGPVVVTDQTIMARCLNGFCDMDLRYDTVDVPEGQGGVAASIIKEMQGNADKTFSCPFRLAEIVDTRIN